MCIRKRTFDDPITHANFTRREYLEYCLRDMPEGVGIEWTYAYLELWWPVELNDEVAAWVNVHHLPPIADKWSRSRWWGSSWKDGETYYATIHYCNCDIPIIVENPHRRLIALKLLHSCSGTEDYYWRIFPSKIWETKRGIRVLWDGEHECYEWWWWVVIETPIHITKNKIIIKQPQRKIVTPIKPYGGWSVDIEEPKWPPPYRQWLSNMVHDILSKDFDVEHWELE